MSHEQLFAGMACMPNALIDALGYLGIDLTQADRQSLQKQRRHQLAFLAEEMSPGGFYSDKDRDQCFIANYELEMASNMIRPFGCLITSATLWTVGDFLSHTSSSERVLAKVLGSDQANHIEHVRRVSNTHDVVCNSHTYPESLFIDMIKDRQDTAGFNALCICSLG